MIEFQFSVNKSFLSGGSHPITVPRSQVDYAALEREGLVGEATVVAPTGTRMRGRVYSGTAGFGPYYQVKVDNASAEPIRRLRLGEQLLVQIQKVDGETVVTLVQQQVYSVMQAG